MQNITRGKAPNYSHLTTIGSRHHGIDRIYIGAKSVTVDISDPVILAALATACVAALAGKARGVRTVCRNAPNAPERYVVQTIN